MQNQEYLFPLLKKKMQHFTIPGTVKHLLFNLQNEGSYFKCQNIHAECDLA